MLFNISQNVCSIINPAFKWFTLNYYYKFSQNIKIFLVTIQIIFKCTSCAINIIVLTAIASSFDSSKPRSLKNPDAKF